MKTFFSISCIFLIISLICSCKQEESSQPCDGNGIITFNNKTDSSVLVQIVEAHNTFRITQNYIMSVSVKGNQKYRIVLDGRNYNKDTSLSVYNCETKNFTIIR